MWKRKGGALAGKGHEREKDSGYTLYAFAKTQQTFVCTFHPGRRKTITTSWTLVDDGVLTSQIYLHVYQKQYGLRQKDQQMGRLVIMPVS